MMHLLTAAEMRACDRRTIEEHHVPGPVLMERAARGIVDVLRRRYAPLNRRVLCFVCGRGNNGGDGLLAARLLHDGGYNPRVLLTDPETSVSGDAALQVAPLAARGVPLEPITSDLFVWLRALSTDDIIIDAILGTGFKGELSGSKGEICAAINASKAHVVAVDIPSGLSADMGHVAGPAIHAEMTVTMGFPKRSFLFWPARAHIGEWSVVDIGIPSEVVEVVRPVARLVTASAVVRKIPDLPPNAHKGLRGRVVAIGGSPGLTGAPCMVALGASHAGAGLVRIGVPRSLNAILETKLTEEMTYPLHETDAGTVSIRARDFILALSDHWNALVLGPGLGRHVETDRLVREVLDGWRGPLLVDADGLNALAAEGIPSLSPMRPAPVLTPHPGEMARLSGSTIKEVEADPIEAARTFAQRHGVVLLLKGAPSVISDPLGNVLVNTTGNPGLATGGSGDVLSGIIGTFLAQGIDPFWAAACGAYMHGLSSDLLARRTDPRAIRPVDVALGLGEAWVALKRDATGA
jgi:ADP-dependent NAD(P)H-hydrate dehydratase / NAD(P)H-hydrate epimerase